MPSPVSYSAPKQVNTYRKSHRIDVHRHADEFLENLEKAKQAEQLNKINFKPNGFIKFIGNLAKGLECMFNAIHIKP